MSQNDMIQEPAEKAGEKEKTAEQYFEEFTRPTSGDVQDDEPEQDRQAEEEEHEDEPKDASGSDVDEGEPKKEAPSQDPADLRAQNERLEQSVRSEKGRTAAALRKIQQLEAEVAEANKRSHRSPEDEDRRKERQAKLDAAHEEYPDVIGPLVEHVKALEARQDELNANESRALERKQEQLAQHYAEQHAIVRKEHADGFALIDRERDAFRAWVDDQPKDIRDIYAQNRAHTVDGQAVAYLIGRFKQSLLGADGDEAPAKQSTDTRLQSRRDRQLDGARTTRSTTQPRGGSLPPKNGGDPKATFDYFTNLAGRQG